MKKVRKGKKMLITLFVTIILIIVAAVVITNVVKNKNKKSTAENKQEQQVVSLPETTTASGLDAKNIYMEYLQDQDRTMITMRITNTTDQKVAEENFRAILIDANDNILGSMPTGTSVDLDVGEQCEVTVIYSGDLTATQRIKLEKME